MSNFNNCEKAVAVGTLKGKYPSYGGDRSPEVENIISRDFHTDPPNTKQLTYITEFPLPAGKVYLSSI